MKGRKYVLINAYATHYQTVKSTQNEENNFNKT